MATKTKKENRPVIVRESVLEDMFNNLEGSPSDETLYAVRRKIADILNWFRFRKPQSRTKPIVVTVEGGLIQNIENPYNLTIIVKDYDVEGHDKYDPWIKKDENGDEYAHSEW